MSLLFTKQVVYVRLRESKPRFYGLFAYGGSNIKCNHNHSRERALPDEEHIFTLNFSSIFSNFLSLAQNPKGQINAMNIH